MILMTLHWLLIAAYLAAPPAAFIYAVGQLFRHRPAAFVALLTTLLIGSALGMIVAVVFGRLMHGRASGWELARCMYFATSLLLLIKGLDLLVSRLLRPLARRGIAGLVAQMLGRVAVVLGAGVPLMSAALLVYQPKIELPGDPFKAAQRDFTSVEFTNGDHIRLAGWWIPAAPRTSGVANSGITTRRRRMRNLMTSPTEGRATLLICHGIGSNKALELPLLQTMTPNGYNVLMFDFRGRGQSQGTLSGVGSLEARDVLAALRWLRTAHPEAAERVVGLGMDTGAAALLQAATDASGDGAALSAIVIFGGFDDAAAWLRDAAHLLFTAPSDRWLTMAALPLASIMAGTDLAMVRPADAAAGFWPRPLLVVHAINDPLVSFDRGRALFDRASFPKQRFWLERGRMDQADSDVARTVREFIENAQAIPAI